jgi:hypothetical protein
MEYHFTENMGFVIPARSKTQFQAYHNSPYWVLVPDISRIIDHLATTIMKHASEFPSPEFLEQPLYAFLE